MTCAPQPEDEEDAEPTLEELEQREVLVLGLDGSGKSTFLRVLSGKPPLEGHIPTWGFNSVRLPTKDFEVDLLESEQTPPHTHHLSISSAGAKPGLFAREWLKNAYLSRTCPCMKSFPASLGHRALHVRQLQPGHGLSLTLLRPTCLTPRY